MSEREGLIRSLLDPEEVERLRDKLKSWAMSITLAQQGVDTTNRAYREGKAALASAIDQKDLIESEVALVAVLDGKIDGKNAETRALQQAVALAENDAVIAAREAVAEAARALVDLEARCDDAKTGYDYCINTFKGALAQASYDAALMGALAALGKETHD